jgi:hypothetical protein
MTESASLPRLQGEMGMNRKRLVNRSSLVGKEAG